jgi:hypothetical protein
MKNAIKKGNHHKKTDLNPQIIIPDSEKWLYENPEALASFNQGLKEAAEGKLTKVNLDNL